MQQQNSILRLVTKYKLTSDCVLELFGCHNFLAMSSVLANHVHHSNQNRYVHRSARAFPQVRKHLKLDVFFVFLQIVARFHRKNASSGSGRQSYFLCDDFRLDAALLSPCRSSHR